MLTVVRIVKSSVFIRATIRYPSTNEIVSRSLDGKARFFIAVVSIALFYLFSMDSTGTKRRSSLQLLRVLLRRCPVCLKQNQQSAALQNPATVAISLPTNVPQKEINVEKRNLIQRCFLLAAPISEALRLKLS